jgi:hypothetical protein
LRGLTGKGGTVPGMAWQPTWNRCEGFTRKHYIKPASIAAMRQLSETLSALPKPKLLADCSPKEPKESLGHG